MRSKINYFVSTHPELAVARGAVMFGMNPLIIKPIIVWFNIGIKVLSPKSIINFLKKDYNDVIFTNDMTKTIENLEK